MPLLPEWRIWRSWCAEGLIWVRWPSKQLLHLNSQTHHRDENFYSFLPQRLLKLWGCSSSQLLVELDTPCTPVCRCTHTFKCAAIVWNMWSNRCDLALTSPRVSLAAVQLMDYALLGNSKLPFQLLSPNRFPRPPNLLCLQEHGFTSERQPWDPGFLCCSRKSHSPRCLFFQFCLKLDFQFRGKSI